MSAVPARVPSLVQFYRRMLRALGPQHWWPAESPFEMMIGAILTQATAWHNVEQAIRRLRAAKALSPRGIAKLPRPVLAKLIRPSGYFRQKAARLQGFTRWYLRAYGANARRMFQQDPQRLRQELLRLKGIGPETADSMLLYAGSQAVCVIDAYTRRVFRRHWLIEGDESYDTLQQFVMERFPVDPRELNEFHALIVSVGKQYCHRRNPDCARCPLGTLPTRLEGAQHA